MSVTNIVRAVVKPGSDYTVTSPIMKENKGQILLIEGLDLPEVYEIDFSNDRHHGTSVTMIGNADGVLIPTQFIKTGRDVFAFYYYVGDNFGQTEHTFRLPNSYRPDRTEEVPEPEQESLIEQAISALNTAVAQTAQGAQTATQKALEASESAQSASLSEQNAANSAETAVNAKNAAEGYANDARSYKEQAASSASSANESANTATVKASEASTSAITASVKADEARASAASASNDAGIASTAAGSANSAASRAEQAKADATVMAQRAANSAQASADHSASAQASATASAQSASQSAQIKTDVQALAAVAQQAVTDATHEADQADISARSASASANSAIASAQSASQSASSASVSAQMASSKASEASQSATTASQKATESASSASQALIYKTDAESAKTASQTAQGLAEDARDDAQQAQAMAENAEANAEATVHGVLDSLTLVETSGSIIETHDAFPASPEKMVVDINPVQDTSSGDPSPENICPISGWTGCNIQHDGANLFDNDTTKIHAVTHGTDDEGEYVTHYGYEIYLPAETYTIKAERDPSLTASRYIYGGVYKKSGNHDLVTIANIWVNKNGYTRTITVEEDEYILYFNATSSASLSDTKTLFSYFDITMWVGTEVGDYAPYQGTLIPIDWETEVGTVYGGKLDVLTGKLTVYPYYASYNGETLTGEWISDRDVYAVGTTPTIGAQVVNIGAEGTEYQLTPQPITLLKDYNALWADTGDISEFAYRAGEFATMADIPEIPVKDVKVNGKSVVQNEMANIDLTDLYKLYATEVANGTITTFDDGADDIPLKSLTVTLEPQQDFNGYDKPWVGGGGKNLFDVTAYESIYTSYDYKESSYQCKRIQLKPNTEYTVSFTSPAADSTCIILLNNITQVNALGFVDLRKASDSKTYTTDDTGCLYIGSANSNDTDYNARMSICKIQIEEGSTATDWTPYENICPITGHTGLNLYRTGGNLICKSFPEDAFYGSWSTGATSISSSSVYKVYCVYVGKNTDVHYTKTIHTNVGMFLAFTDEYATSREGVVLYDALNMASRYGNVLNSGEHPYLLVALPTDNVANQSYEAREARLYFGAQFQPFFPRRNIDKYAYDWTEEAGTVYGCTIDIITGVLSVNWICVKVSTSNTDIRTGDATAGNPAYPYGRHMRTTLSGALLPISGLKCDSLEWIAYDTFENTDIGVARPSTTSNNIYWKTPQCATAEGAEALRSADIHFCYKLATPIEYQLEPHELASILGGNQIWTDNGTIDVEYRADTRLYIEKLTRPEEDDMIADSAITSGQFFMIGNSLYRALANIASGATITVGTNAQRVSLSDALNLVNA